MQNFKLKTKNTCLEIQAGDIFTIRDGGRRLYLNGQQAVLIFDDVVEISFLSGVVEIDLTASIKIQGDITSEYVMLFSLEENMLTLTVSHIDIQEALEEAQ